MMKRTILCAVVVLCGAGQVNATVLFDNGPAVSTTLSGGGGWTNVVGSPGPSHSGGIRVWDNFTLPRKSRIESVFFQIAFDSRDGGPNEFLFSIFEGSYVGPERIRLELSPPDYTSTANTIVANTDRPDDPFVGYDISFDLPTPLTLDSGLYYISFPSLTYIGTVTLGVGSGDGFIQQDVLNDFTTPSGTKHHRSGDTPFRIDGAVVPEPSTLTLAAFGLLGLLAFRRRI